MHNKSLFFSAVFQGNMALLGVLGVFVVFRTQLLANELAKVEMDMITFINNYISQGFVNQSYKPDITFVQEDLPTIKEKLDQYSKDKNYRLVFQQRTGELLQDNHLMELHNKRDFFIVSKNNITKQFTFPLMLTVVVILLSLIILPVICYIDFYSSQIEILIIIFIALLNIFSLSQIVRFTFNMLKR